jgi:hypothetical protein
LPDGYLEEWQSSGRSFAVLAGLQWKLLLDALDAVRGEAGEALVDIRYEDLCARPMETIERICAHCALEMDRALESAVDGTRFRDANPKWKDGFGDEQKRLLTESLRTHLDRFGYREA